MRKVTRPQIAEILTALGIEPGDGLLVHSALQYLGLPEGGPGMYLDAIQPIIGSAGTIAVPTFNFAFAKGEDYDPSATPSVGMGAFSEFVRKHPQAHRTSHPLQSLAVIGRLASEMAACDTPSAFDAGSAFEMMLDHDFKLLLLGADVQAAAITHYCEQRARVPYRYWKDFTGRVRSGDAWQVKTYRMYVRDLALDPQLTARPVQAVLEERGQWRQQPVNYGIVSTCRVRHFTAVMDEILAEDPWALVMNRPQHLSSTEGN